MTNNFAEARNRKVLKSVEAADQLGVNKVTLSSWETGLKTPGIDSIIKMADLYECSIDYLVGRTEHSTEAPAVIREIDFGMLNIYHGRPVWSSRYGWLLVNGKRECLTAADGTEYKYEDVGRLFTVPENYALSSIPGSYPLDLQTITREQTVWVEPISSDRVLAEKLRGNYHPNGAYVENELGQKFYLDTLGKDWMAFKK
ncbi:MAG: helix-turn-helix transcriptional regulator [Clostridia bacterium]|nr:helix-turn-helix transcriptional regulator [Clostridia bacterium]